LNVIDTRFNLFLKDCHKSLDREDVSNQMIEFGTIDDNDVIFNKFNVPSLPESFTIVDEIKSAGKGNAKVNSSRKTKPTNNNSRKGKHKIVTFKDIKNKGRQKRAHGAAENKDQVPEFNMKEGEIWEKLHGICIDF
jgi:hypothetical protein